VGRGIVTGARHRSGVCAWHLVLRRPGVAPGLELAKGGQICYNMRRCPGRMGKDPIARSMRTMEIVRFLRQEVKAALKLSPWLLISLLVAAVLVGVDPAATWGLFQSPLPAATSPLPTETVALPPETLPPPPEMPTLAATLIVTPTQTPIITATATLVPTVLPTEMPPVATAAPLTPTVPLVPSVSPQLSEPEATVEEIQHYAAEDSNFKFEWGMLFDSFALGASYVWMCCGVLLLVLVPVFFIVLWVASKRRRQGNDQQQLE
jgi:hypothetical protein